MENQNDFHVLLSNKTAEEETTDDDISSAGQFRTSICPGIDLGALTYLRSVDCLMGLESIYVDSFPITFSQFESILLYLDVDSTLSKLNVVVNGERCEQQNKSALRMKMTDFSADSTKAALEYLNTIFSSKINTFLLARLSELFCDMNFMNFDHFSELGVEDSVKITNDENDLMTFYFNCAFYVRNVIHEKYEHYLTGVRQKSNIMPKIENDTMSRTRQNKILANSDLLKEKEEWDLRTHANTRTIDFQVFFDKDLSQAENYDYETEIVAEHQFEKTWKQIRDQIENKLEQQLLYLRDCLTRDAEGKLTDDAKSMLRYHQNKNKTLMNFGLFAKDLLCLETKKNNSIGKTCSNLLTDNFLRLKIDSSGQKCRFSINAQDFLPESTEIRLELPEQVSYVLGAGLNIDGSVKRVKLGPFNKDYRDDHQRSPISLSSNITSANHRLPNHLRIIPRVLNIASSIVDRSTRDEWLNSTPYKNYFILCKLELRSEFSESNFITKSKTDTTFFRVQHPKSVLDRVDILLLDENFRKLVFSRMTFVKFSLIFKACVSCS